MSNPTHFHRYTAMGNDMLVIDPLCYSINLTTKNVQKICNRHFGIGADGICYGPLNDSQPFEMKFFNPDGTEAEKSGNGLRIFARYLRDADYVTKSEFDIRIANQVSHVKISDTTKNTFQISMGQATFQNDNIPAIGEVRKIVHEPLSIDDTHFRITCVNVGNPHCVIFTDCLDMATVKHWGAILEIHPMFPQRTNVQWVRIKDEHTIQIEIWERGAGYTLASGTSACATACASIVNGYCRSPITVKMAGGEAIVKVDSDWNLELAGSVQSIARGYFSSDFISILE